MLMMQSLTEIITNAVKEYINSKRDEWVLKWPGMVVLCAATINWTAEVENAIEKKSLTVRENFKLISDCNLVISYLFSRHI